MDGGDGGMHGTRSSNRERRGEGQGRWRRFLGRSYIWMDTRDHLGPLFYQGEGQGTEKLGG